MQINWFLLWLFSPDVWSHANTGDLQIKLTRKRSSWHWCRLLSGPRLHTWIKTCSSCNKNSDLYARESWSISLSLVNNHKLGELFILALCKGTKGKGNRYKTAYVGSGPINFFWPPWLSCHPSIPEPDSQTGITRRFMIQESLPIAGHTSLANTTWGTWISTFGEVKAQLCKMTKQAICLKGDSLNRVFLGLNLIWIGFGYEDHGSKMPSKHWELSYLY